MVIDVTKPLVNMDGTPLKDVDSNNNAVDVMLRTAIVNALLAPVEKETGIDKAAKYDLAMRVYQNNSVDISAEEIALIKKRVGELFSPIVVGQVFRILEGKDAQ